MFGGFFDYVRQGAMYAAGAEPIAMGAAAIPGGPAQSMMWDFGPLSMRQNKGSLLPTLVGESEAFKGMTRAGKVGAYAGALGGAAGTAYSLYHGYSEAGLGGMYEMGVWELAASAGAARWAYGTEGAQSWSTLGGRTAGKALKNGGFISMGARSLGASAGAAIGQSLAGSPGAFIGGYLGAAPVAAMSAHPGALLAGAAGAAAMTAGYGAYHVVKGVAARGYQHAQLKRGIDTSGSLAAFNTRGANTMRGRAVQAMHKSHQNARSALGQEASFMSFPGRNYHSRYR